MMASLLVYDCARLHAVDMYEKRPLMCAGAISGIVVAGVVALVLFVFLMITLAFILHLKHRICEQNRKLKWSDVVEEVDFIIQVRFI